MPERIERAMSIGTVVGIMILAGSISLSTSLVIWSARSINWIDRKKQRKLREIIRERRGEK